VTQKTLNLTGLAIVSTILVVALVTLYVMLDDSDIVESSRAFLRVSGRAGMALFFISFGASPLHRIFRSSWTSILIKYRRYFGISCAIVLWMHFLVILSLSITAPSWFDENAPWYILYSGSLVFLLVGLMALSSNNYWQRKLGIKNWRRLHIVGGYAALAGFISEYVLVLYLQPVLLPGYVFVVKNSLPLVYSLFAVPLLLLALRLRRHKKTRGVNYAQV
tara:strand:+ start:408 stop:1067 length:660 start_codon:yes stop_codon:yes gene_type:complete